MFVLVKERKGVYLKAQIQSTSDALPPLILLCNVEKFMTSQKFIYKGERRQTRVQENSRKKHVHAVSLGPSIPGDRLIAS